MKRYVRYNEKSDLLTGIKLILIGMAISAVLFGVIFLVVKLRSFDKEKPDYENNAKKAVRVAQDIAEDVVFGSEGEVETETKLTLKDVVEIDEFQTFSYNYNSTCPYTVGNEKTTAFYTAYEGTITFGLNTEDIEVLTDDNAKLVFLFLPELERTYSVDAGTLQYIFVDEAYESNSDVPSIAYKLAIQNLKKKSSDDEYMMGLAKENTENQLRALTEPLIKTMFGNDYKVEINWNEEVD